MEEKSQNRIDVTARLAEGQREFWDNWMKATIKGTDAVQSMWREQVTPDMLTMWSQTWLKSSIEPFVGKEPSEGVDGIVNKRLTEASTIYNNLFAFWTKGNQLLAQLSTGTAPTTEKLKEIHDQWIKEYQTVIGSLWGISPSRDAEKTARTFQSTTTASAESGWRFMEPLLKNMEELPEILTRISKGDTGAGNELTGLLRKNYEATLGKLLGAPTMGYFREFQDKINHTADAYVNYNSALTRYFVPFYQSGMGAAEKVFQRFSEFNGKEVTPETFNEFYQFWWKTNEDVYGQMLGSADFTELLGEVLQQGLTFKKHLDDLSDQFMRFTNLPTKQDMDEIYKTIYELKKEVRSQKRSIKDLEHRLETTVARTTPIASKRIVQKPS